VVPFGVRFQSHEVTAQIAAKLACRGPSYFGIIIAIDVMGAPVRLHRTESGTTWVGAVLTSEGSKAL
jgi:hypothetical protein